NESHENQIQSMEWRSFLGWRWPKQQLNTWPVSLVTLSQLPDIYLHDNLAALAQFQNGPKLNERQQDAVTRGFIDNAARIQESVKRLEVSFNPDTECVKE